MISPGESPILDPMRRVGLGAELALAVGFLVLIITIEPDDPALALEREQVRGTAIEEPDVVAD